MKPKAASRLPERVFQIYRDICTVIAILPPEIEVDAFFFGRKMSRTLVTTHTVPDCHTISRALSSFFPVRFHDGYVWEHRKVEDKKGILHWHSWLTVEDCDPDFIIDPWPLGSVSGPAIFIQNYGFRLVKVPGLPRTKTNEFQNCLTTLIEVMSYELRSLEAPLPTLRPELEFDLVPKKRRIALAAD